MGLSATVLYGLACMCRYKEEKGTPSPPPPSPAKKSSSLSSRVPSWVCDCGKCLTQGRRLEGRRGGREGETTEVQTECTCGLISCLCVCVCVLVCVCECECECECEGLM